MSLLQLIWLGAVPLSLNGFECHSFRWYDLGLSPSADMAWGCPSFNDMTWGCPSISLYDLGLSLLQLIWLRVVLFSWYGLWLSLLQLIWLWDTSCLFFSCYCLGLFPFSFYGLCPQIELGMKMQDIYAPVR